jgi:carotenoid cleavage dioxygenase-like enzyme
VTIHLEGNNRPVIDEHDGLQSFVVGELPADLAGVYLRNGPNPRTGWSPHLYAGDGMVHSVALPEGSYRNRWIRTPLFDDATTRRDGRRVTTANTHVIAHGRHLLTLEEGGLPYEITNDLATLGPFDFGGALTGPMTAHPKTCPTSGELLFFGYSIAVPFLMYYRADADGQMLQALPIDLDVPSMMHDFAITETRVVFYDSPFTFDASLLATGFPWRWDAEHGASIGVMDRTGGPVRWTQVSDAHLSHAANAWDDGDTIVLTGTRIGSPTDMPRLHEWRVDPTAGTVAERPLWDTPTEYPRIADRFTGHANQHVYTSSFFFTAEPDHGEINRHHDTTTQTHRLPHGHTCGEPVHVPTTDGNEGEDDGYLLTFAHDRLNDSSYLLVLDASTLANLAEVHLPYRVPGGFHGTWIPYGAVPEPAGIGTNR